jgi:hypothetical protein
MDLDRAWIIKASLAQLGASFAFFILARPIFGFPMVYEEVIRVLQIIFPVFVGYLGIAAAYVSQQPDAVPIDTNSAAPKFSQLLLRGPIYLVGMCSIVLIASFWVSNLPSAKSGGGMSLDNFCWFLSLLMGLLAASSGLVVTRLFPANRKRSKT